ncbi:MAG: chromate transporter, partial [Candidatus Dormibacteraeota bacterium]|nr:chromate transporter [Candidatus Dormibacteraeota bacterium]
MRRGGCWVVRAAVSRLPPRGDSGLTEVARCFLLLGCVAFGGPAAHVTLMRRLLVVRRHWVGDEEFFALFAAVQLIPGPSSTELALLLGYKRAGWRGLLVAGACFIMPAALLMLGLAALY